MLKGMGPFMVDLMNVGEVTMTYVLRILPVVLQHNLDLSEKDKTSFTDCRFFATFAQSQDFQLLVIFFLSCRAIL